MRRKFRLSQKADFQDLFGRGKRVDSPLFRLVYRKNTIGHVRLALAAPRSIDKRSVRRNLLRRRTRELVRTHKELINQSVDLAILFKKEAVLAPKKIFYEELNKTLARISIV